MSQDPSRVALQELSPLLVLLSRLIMREVDASLLETLRHPGILEVLEKAEPGCAAYLNDCPWTPAMFEEAAVDFTGLFILPNGLRPQSSAWLPGERERVGGHVAAQINNAMQALRLQWRDPDLARLPADHLAVLLSVVAQAAGSEACTHRKIGQALFEQTLASWLPAIGEKIQTAASTPLYRAMGGLMAQLLKLDGDAC